jgi:mannose-6-phosphate isomerase-like protein (cupin superfamily)
MDDIQGTRFPAPHARTIKHLLAPWTAGSAQLWLGVSELGAGSSSNPHAHPQQEEAFVVLSGSGTIRVAGTSVPVRAGSVVLVAPGEQH